MSRYMHKRSKQRIKQIIFHYEDSSKFIIYDLDADGRHIALKNRAQRTNYKKINQEKLQKINSQSSSSSEELMNQDVSLFNLDYNPTDNFNLEIGIGEDFHVRNYDDQIELLCSPLIAETENNSLFAHMISDSDNLDLYAQDLETINLDI